MLAESVAVPNAAAPFLNVTVPVRVPAPETAAVKVIGFPSFAGLAELVSVVVVPLMSTGTVELPVATVEPSVTLVAVSVALPTVLFVNEKVLVPPTSAARLLAVCRLRRWRSHQLCQSS